MPGIDLTIMRVTKVDVGRWEKKECKQTGGYQIKTFIVHYKPAPARHPDLTEELRIDLSRDDGK